MICIPVCYTATRPVVIRTARHAPEPTLHQAWQGMRARALLFAWVARQPYGAVWSEANAGGWGVGARRVKVRWV